jgi:acyl-CoA thioester hydrolase
MTELPWDLPSAFTTPTRVAPDEVDRLQHVNNAVYLAWCEEVGWRHTDSVGLPWERWAELDRAMAVLHARLDFVRPALLGDEVMLATWIAANDGRVRIRRRFQFIRTSDAATLLRAELEFVCIEISSGRPRRLPSEFVETYRVLPEVAAALARAC